MPENESPETDLSTAVGVLRRAVHRLEPKHLSGKEAAELVRVFAEGERLCTAGKTMAARAVEKSRAWQAGGHKSAAHWLAAETGVAVGQAVGTMETARRLEHLPRTTEAFACGELSETKVKEVSIAAAACPGAETELVNAARTDTVKQLQVRCSTVVATAGDEVERYRRIRAKRNLRHWTDTDGAFRMALSTTPDAGADLLAAMEPHRRRIAEQARKARRTESSQAYAADALVALAREGTGSSGPRITSVIHVDHAAFLRGHAEPGERCEIAGIGPIPVATARCPDGRLVPQAGGEQGNRRDHGGPRRADHPRRRAHRGRRPLPHLRHHRVRHPTETGVPPSSGLRQGRAHFQKQPDPGVRSPP
jgi:hypothetical protein